MKNTVLRILISAILLTLISGIVESITGIMPGWKTSTQFSDGFFWAGAIVSAGIVGTVVSAAAGDVQVEVIAS